MNALEPVAARAAVLRENARQVLDSETRAGSTARALRDELVARPFRLYISVITALAVFYYVAIATPVFVSQSQFAIKGKAPVPTVPLLAAMAGQTTTGLTEMTAISQYIQSPELLAKIEKKLKLREQYSKPRIDFMNYLSPGASDIEFLSFYKSMLSGEIDTDANIVTLQAMGYDAKSAQSLANMILEESGNFIDNLSDQMRSESIRSAEIDYKTAFKDAIKAKTAVSEFRAKVGNLDPTAFGSAASSAIVSMESQIAALNTQMAALKTYSTDQSPQIQQIQAQIKYLQQKIGETQRSMVSKTEDNSINKQLDQYHDLTLQQTYADQRLTTAQAALDQARSVASQRELFVVAITHPNLPDRPTLPTRLWNILTIVVLAATIYGMVRLGLAGVRDHQGG